MNQPGTVRHIDDLAVDLARRKVRRAGGADIPLSALSFDTLLVLIDASPGVATTDRLIERAWRGAVVSDETVTQRIRLLRRALGDDRHHPRYIETVRNVGYRLVPVVSESPPASRRPASLPHGLVAGALLAVAFAAMTWLLPQDEGASTDGAATFLPDGAVTAAELAERAKNLARQRNEAGLRHAIELYEKALRIEPGDAGIRLGLSMALSTATAWYGDSLEQAVRAERLAREVLSQDDSFDAEFALAFSLDAQGRIEPAQAAYERAVALDPAHWGARSSLAYLLQEKGRLVEALSNDMIAFELAPPGVLDTQIAGCLRLLGFHDAASEWLQRTDLLYPESVHAAPARALDLLTRGDDEDARAVIEDALARGVVQVELYEYLAVLALLDDDARSAAAAIDSVPASIRHRGAVAAWRTVIDAMASGNGAAAVALVSELRAAIDAGDTWPGNFLYIAMLEAAAGLPDAALESLRQLEAAGYRDHLWLRVLPPLRALHDDPRFAAVVDGMRDDVARQRAQVLTADWLPPVLRTARLDPVTP